MGIANLEYNRAQTLVLLGIARKLGVCLRDITDQQAVLGQLSEHERIQIDRDLLSLIALWSDVRFSAQIRSVAGRADWEQEQGHDLTLSAIAGILNGFSVTVLSHTVPAGKEYRVRDFGFSGQDKGRAQLLIAGVAQADFYFSAYDPHQPHYSPPLVAAAGETASVVVYNLGAAAANYIVVLQGDESSVS